MAGIIPAPLTPQLEQSGAVAVEGGTLAASNPEALATAQAGLPGLVAVQQQGREKRYSFTPEPLDELEQWLKDINARWDLRLLRLKTMIENEGR